MKQEITLNESVKEAVTTALIRMMKKKPIGEIQIKDLVKIAGVSRSSFYRNFESKEDVLVKYAEKFSLNFAKSLDDYSSPEEFLIERYRSVKKEKDFFIALNKNNLVYFIYRSMDESMTKGILDSSHLSETEKIYQTSRMIGGTVGIIIEWINRDFKESEEELAAMFKDIVR